MPESMLRMSPVADVTKCPKTKVPADPHKKKQTCVLQKFTKNLLQAFTLSFEQERNTQLTQQSKTTLCDQTAFHAINLMF